jgi:hypothetical protein
MNGKQKKVLLGSGFIFLLMFLFPPWLYIDENTSNQRSAGYHFINSPPPIKSHEEMFGTSEYDYYNPRAVRKIINPFRLFAQVIVMLFIISGVYGWSRKGDSSFMSNVHSGAFQIGIAMLILFAYLCLSLSSNSKI